MTEKIQSNSLVGLPTDRRTAVSDFMTDMCNECVNKEVCDPSDIELIESDGRIERFEIGGSLAGSDKCLIKTVKPEGA